MGLLWCVALGLLLSHNRALSLSGDMAFHTRVTDYVRRVFLIPPSANDWMAEMYPYPKFSHRLSGLVTDLGLGPLCGGVLTGFFHLLPTLKIAGAAMALLGVEFLRWLVHERRVAGLVLPGLAAIAAAVLGSPFFWVLRRISTNNGPANFATPLPLWQRCGRRRACRRRRAVPTARRP